MSLLRLALDTSASLISPFVKPFSLLLDNNPRKVCYVRPVAIMLFNHLTNQLALEYIVLGSLKSLSSIEAVNLSLKLTLTLTLYFLDL